MPSENVEVVRHLVKANRSGDLESAIETALALTDPRIEFQSVMAAVKPETYRGHDGLRRYFGELADSWEEWRMDPEEVFDAGPDTVIAVFSSHLVGKGSGVAVGARRAMVCSMCEGKVLRARVYPSREQALEAVGPNDATEGE
jgi:ketosteroid isomerase-like protein